jgi:two-component system chemotaxis response regulator CheB
MPPREVVVIGASAGGVEALMTLVAALPGELPAAVFVVQHVPADGTSALPAILSRVGALPAAHAVDNEPIRRGRIYVAPPDLHLIVHRDRVRVVHGPRENRSRPAIDPLFRSAAMHFGRRVIGIVLSGALDDGTAGLAIIKRLGGVAIVQDPEEALVRSMPDHALAFVDVDHCLPLTAIAETVVELTQTALPLKGATRMAKREADELAYETQIAELDLDAIEDDGRPGAPSPFGCPECGGVLWERDDDDVLRFRGRVGHAYSAASLFASQSEAIEGALWSALRALEEKSSLTKRLLDRAEMRKYKAAMARYQEQFDDAERQAEVIRSVLLGSRWIEGNSLSPSDPLARAGAVNPSS